MTEIINIYCDESCHLKNDKETVMGFASIWCPKIEVKKICRDIRKIKENVGINKYAEIKWTKISPKLQSFYIQLVEYFFNNESLKFRAVIIPDKNKLCPESFGNTHDDFYYIMYYNTLKHFIDPNNKYNIYFDIKDTKSWEKTSGLKNWLLKYILSKNYYVSDNSNIINKIQIMRSYESELMQLADLLLGATIYKNRGIFKSTAKLHIAETIEELRNYPLTATSFYSERKFNVLVWNAKEILD